MAKKSKKNIVAVSRGSNRSVIKMDGKYVYFEDGTKQRILAAQLEIAEAARKPILDMEWAAQAIQTEPQE